MNLPVIIVENGWAVIRGMTSNVASCYFAQRTAPFVQNDTRISLLCTKEVRLLSSAQRTIQKNLLTSHIVRMCMCGNLVDT